MIGREVRQVRDERAHPLVVSKLRPKLGIGLDLSPQDLKLGLGLALRVEQVKQAVGFG